MEMQRYISAEAFEHLMAQPEYADRSCELVEGRIFEMSQHSGEHGEIESQLHYRLAGHVYANQLGRVASGDIGFVLERHPEGRDTLRGIDIAFISFDKSPEPLPRSAVPFAPDLAVEVVSPSNTAADIHLKVRQLLRAGTTLVWVVYPETRSVEAHTDDGAMTYAEDDTLHAGDVLPGFTVRVGDIFPA